MHILKAFAYQLAFATCITAVLLNDAFVHDWTKHWVGKTIDYSIVDTSAAIGLSDHAQLFKINITGNNSDSDTPLLWRVDLKDLGTNHKYLYLSRQNEIYTFSPDHNVVYAWNVDTGTLMNKYTTKSGPVNVINFFNRGVLIVGSNGEIEYFGQDGDYKHIGDISPSSSVYSSNYNGNLYLVSSNLVTVINGGNFTVVGQYTYTESTISQLVENIIVTVDNTMLRVDIQSLNTIKALPVSRSIKLINSDYFIAYSHDLIEVFQIQGNSYRSVDTDLNVTNILDVDYQSYLLSDFLIITTTQEKLVVDITGLLSDNDPTGLQLLKFDHHTNENVVVQNFVEYDSVTSVIRLINGEINNEAEIVFTSFASNMDKALITKFSNQYFTSESSKNYIIVDKQKSTELLNIVHDLLEVKSSESIISRLLIRSIRHLKELGRFTYQSLATGKFAYQETSQSNEDIFGYEKIIIFYDEVQKMILAVNSIDGSFFWQLKVNNDNFIEFLQVNEGHVYAFFEKEILDVNLRTGSIESEITSNEKIRSSITLKIGDEYKHGYVSNNNVVLFDSVTLDEDKYFIDSETAQGLKLLQSSSQLINTWKLPISKAEKILGIYQVSNQVSSIGIVQHDKSVLYKYLYPNLATIATFDDISKVLRIYLVDIITGSILHSQVHKDEKIDPNSFKATIGNNWIIYTYFAFQNRPEQRVVVIDLFETGISNAKNNEATDESLSVFTTYNQTIGYFSSKAFLLTEKILQISHTVTNWDITTTDILILTETGSILQIPKYILNSRRIADRTMTPEDFASEFKITPYVPVLRRDDYYNYLNHKSKLAVSENSSILVKPTNLESTSVVCVFGDLDWFCTTVSPSSEYDKLQFDFPKSSLLITVAVMLLAVLFSKSMADKKILNSQWTYRK